MESRISRELGDLSSIKHQYSFRIDGVDWQFEIPEFRVRDFVQLVRDGGLYENQTNKQKMESVRTMVVNFLAARITAGGSAEAFGRAMDTVSHENIGLIAEAVISPLLEGSKEEKGIKKKPKLKNLLPLFFGCLRLLCARARERFLTRQ